MGKMFRLLRADEIEARVQMCREKGVSLLLYKDARCDMNILDEVATEFGWQRQHKELKGNIYCGVGLCLDGVWIWKWDCGAESNTEKEKGEASDSFKRACVNWGIGRELYTSPFIWVPADKCKKLTQDNKGNWKCGDRFTVREIGYYDRTIDYLIIENDKHEIVYQFGDADPKQRARKHYREYCMINALDETEMANKYGLNKESIAGDFLKALEGMKYECK